MTACDREQLLDLAAEVLTPEERATVFAHLKGCALCAADWSAMQALQRAAKKMRNQAVEPAMRERVWAKLQPEAAQAALTFRRRQAWQVVLADWRLRVAAAVLLTLGATWGVAKLAPKGLELGPPAEPASMGEIAENQPIFAQMPAVPVLASAPSLPGAEPLPLLGLEPPSHGAPIGDQANALFSHTILHGRVHREIATPLIPAAGQALQQPIQDAHGFDIVAKIDAVIAQSQWLRAQELALAYLDGDPIGDDAVQVRMRLAGIDQRLGLFAQAAQLYRAVAEGPGALSSRDNAMALLAWMYRQHREYAEEESVWQAYLQRFDRGLHAREALLRLGELSCGRGDPADVQVRATLAQRYGQDAAVVELLRRCAVMGAP